MSAGCYVQRYYGEMTSVTQWRNALPPKLISGELRVKDAERFIGRAV